MNFNYYRKIQNSYKINSKRERDLFKINQEAEKHWGDTIDCETVQINGETRKLIVMKDTDGNTYKKKIKAPHNQPFNLGDYIKWNNQVWIVTAADPNEKVWHSGYMYLCTLLLNTVDENGNLVQRWAYAEDYTKYSKGETGNSNIRLPDYQYGITIPIDDETSKWYRRKRFCVDLPDADTPDTYIMTNRKLFLSNYSYFERGGIMTNTLSLSVFNKKTDKLVDFDGKKYWIADYADNTSSVSSTDYKCSISGKSDITIGKSRSYTVVFDDDTIIDFEWNIVSSFSDDIQLTKKNTNGSCIELYIDNDEHIDEIFKLQIVSNNNVIAEKTITIHSIFG